MADLDRLDMDPSCLLLLSNPDFLLEGISSFVGSTQAEARGPFRKIGELGVSTSPDAVVSLSRFGELTLTLPIILGSIEIDLMNCLNPGGAAGILFSFKAAASAFGASALPERAFVPAFHSR